MTAKRIDYLARAQTLEEALRTWRAKAKYLERRVRELEQELARVKAGKFDTGSPRTASIGRKARAVKQGAHWSEEPFSVPRMRAAWGGEAPDWIVLLAETCDATSQAQVAKLLGVSAALVNQALGKRYAGRLDRLEARVRGVVRKASD